MAAHLRTQIREAVAALVTGLATTGTRVYQSRVYPLSETDLPALLVSTGDESIVRGDLGARILERTLRVEVAGVARANSDLDDTLDQIAKEVEIALAGPPLDLGGAKWLNLVDLTPEEIGEAEKPTGKITLGFEAFYMTPANAPDQAL